MAFCWREGQLLGLGGEAYRDSARQWALMWSAFWAQIGERFGLGGGVIVAERVFENETFMHMLRWRRTVDRAGLDETAQGLSAWLEGRPFPSAPWRDFARDQAILSMPALPDRDDAGRTIAAAAGALMGEAGVPAVTHRAVADRAGITLGMVLHRFRSKQDLLAAAFEDVYLSTVNRIGRDTNTRPDVPPIHAPAAELAVHNVDLGRVDLGRIAGAIAASSGGLGLHELFLAAARDPALGQFAAQLRYLRGRSSRATVQGIAGTAAGVGSLEAALFSGFSSSQLRAARGGLLDQPRERLEGELEIVAGLIRGVPR